MAVVMPLGYGTGQTTVRTWPRLVETGTLDGQSAMSANLIDEPGTGTIAGVRATTLTRRAMSSGRPLLIVG